MKSYTGPICFKTEVIQSPLPEVYSTHDVNSNLDLFNELYLNTLSRQAPTKCVKIKGDQTNLPAKK